MRTAVTKGVLVWLLAAMAPAWAAAPGERAFSVVFENDLFYKTDHDYTNGVEFSYTTAPDGTPDWADQTAHLLPFFSDSEGTVRTRFALGQAMFTPNDITLANPPLSDRPYAGFLFGAVGVTGESEGYFDQVQMMLGITGPASLAEESQKFIHAIVHARKPTGWHYQLRNEPGVVIQYERTLTTIHRAPVLGLELDVEPHFGGAIGNVWDYINAGVMARIGFNIPEDYGPMRIEPSMPGSDYFEPQPEKDFGAYLFAGIEGRAVGRNLFLDGNSFEASRSVFKLNMVGDLVTGAAITFDFARLAFTHVIRSREYRTQKGDDQYGAIDLTLRF